MLVFEVLGFAEGLLPVFGQTWLATARPHTSGSVFFAKLVKGQYGKSVFEPLHSDEKVKIMHIHLRFFTRLDLSVSCHHCYGGFGSL